MVNVKYIPIFDQNIEFMYGPKMLTCYSIIFITSNQLAVDCSTLQNELNLPETVTYLVNKTSGLIYFSAGK